MKKIRYDANNLKSFDIEWGIHKKCKEWWYATGTLNDDDGNLYSYQFTFLNLNFGVVTPKVVMIAFTDLQSGRHHYLQKVNLLSSKVTISDKRVAFEGVTSVEKKADHMQIELSHKDFKLSLKAQYGKGAFWHCDNGKLQMALPGEKETTLYYSYTNMPTTGSLTLNGKAIDVSGKTWFDKQGGTYSLTKTETSWEWFSLRFYDDEEMMLFTFPQSNYQDGTYITADGQRERLNNYEIKTTRIIEKIGMKWSSGWSLYVPGKKEAYYSITPIVEGNMNFAYFEELCWIKNANGTTVGLCFVELLGGVLNEKSNQSISNLLKSIEY
jgi:predicted secreted hydrolase